MRPCVAQTGHTHPIAILNRTLIRCTSRSLIANYPNPSLKLSKD